MSETTAPRATYRLQLSADFDLDAAAGLAHYLAGLGVSHVYLSPCFAARAGSTHGYDIVDHNRVSNELGGAAAHARLVAALRSHGLAIVQDFVPNHVGIGGATNLWWLDALEFGEASPHAKAFDIQWWPDRQNLAGRVLVPFLGEQYGQVLEAGGFELRIDELEGSLSVWLAGGHRLPLRPEDYGEILAGTAPELAPLATAFAALSRQASPRDAALQLKQQLAVQLRDHHVLQALREKLQQLGGIGGERGSFDALDKLIARQHWRAASWRVAAHDINYRRFFNINELAGLRVEDSQVFDAMHQLIVRQLAESSIDGIRIDHIDGLYDPAGYCARLREVAGRPFYLVVEKILASHEELPPWPVHGTTGYEFAALATSLFIDPEAATVFTRSYDTFTGRRATFDSIVIDCKRLVMQSEMAGELAVLAREAATIAHSRRHSQDFTLQGLQDALVEIIAHFPVYRTYVNAAGASDADAQHIDWAIRRARRVLPDTDASVFDFLGHLLRGEAPPPSPTGLRTNVLNFAMKFQQYTGPVMAKGMEDTAFYRYNRLLCLNEVGARPDQFGVSVAAFHRENAKRLKATPHALLASSTHDTKRGEDARARLAALTELPEEWEAQVRAWSRLVRARLGDVEATAAPDRNDEYLLLQNLLAAWPAEWSDPAVVPAADELVTFGARLHAAVVKSVREAREQSSWSRPDEIYEARLREYIDACLDVSRANGFLESFRPFQARVANLAVNASLGQLTLRLTVPGVPDIYQGSEFWDLSLVDPDNRRPVDFALRSRALAAAVGAGVQQATDLAAALAHWPDGRIKLLITARLLALRREHAALFATGDYEPVVVEGTAAPHLAAFTRAHADLKLVVLVTRLPLRLQVGGGYGDTRIRLTPSADEERDWQGVDVLSGRSWPGVGDVRVADLLQDLPVAVFLLRR